MSQRYIDPRSVALYVGAIVSDSDKLADRFRLIIKATDYAGASYQVSGLVNRPGRVDFMTPIDQVRQLGHELVAKQRQFDESWSCNLTP